MIKITMNSFIRSYLPIAIKFIFFAYLMFTSGTVLAQAEEPFQLAVYEGNVYLYVLESPSGQFSYNFYRKLSGESDFVKINDHPVESVANGEQLRAILGNEYDRIRRSADVTSEDALLALARRNSTESLLLSLAYPSLAQSVNKLYVDEGVAEGDNVEYRVEVLNQRGEPTGEEFNNSILVEEPELGEIDIVDVYNEGRRVTVEWTYTPVEEDDQVFRFNVYSADPGSDTMNRVNRGIILRDLNQDTFRYTFNTERTGSEIEIRVGSVSITTEQGPLSEPEQILIEDNIPPSVIQRVRTSLVEDSVQVQWRVSREMDAAGYHVYRGTESDGEFERINSEMIPVQQPFYFDDDIEQGKRYLYKITALDESGNESEQSTAVPRIIPDNTPPSEPADLTAQLNSENDRVNLNWIMPKVPDDLRNYIVLRRIVEGRSPSANYSQISPDDLKETGFQVVENEDAGFEEGALYRFGVVAADSSRNFSDTTFVDVRIPNVTPPDQPNAVRAQNRDGVRVNISWSGSLSRDVGSYNLYRKTGNEEFELAVELDSGERQYRDEQIEIGDSYVYAISAVDTSGNESDLVETEEVLVKRSNPPRRVRNVRAVQTSEGVRIRWEPVASDHLAGYKVYVADRSTGNFEPIHENLISETSLTADTGTESIWFRVTALDITGNESRPSEPVRLIVP